MTPSCLQVEEILERTRPRLKDAFWPRLCHEEREAQVHYLEAKFDYNYFIFIYSFYILYKKFQVISSKNKAVMLILPIQNKIKIWENRHHAFIFAQNDMKFFV